MSSTRDAACLLFYGDARRPIWAAIARIDAPSVPLLERCGIRAILRVEPACRPRLVSHAQTRFELAFAVLRGGEIQKHGPRCRAPRRSKIDHQPQVELSR